MINPISFLWRQFNGPQITAICQALWQYMKDSFDTSLEYFDKLSISTANSDHLTWIGILQGLARPLIPIPDETMFLFDEEYGYIEDPDNPGHMIPDTTSYPSERGFADVGEVFGEGGKLDYEMYKSGYSYLPDYIFRACLSANSSSEGMLGGLVALDDIIYGIWKMEHPTTVPVYQIKWAGEQDTKYTRADIFVDLGVTGDWAFPYETQAEIKLLGTTVYFPIPKLIPILVEGDSSIDPYGFIRILSTTDGDVFGLDAMWAGEGTPSDWVNNGEEPEFDVNPITNSELQLMWAQDNTWIDEEAPSLEFIAMTESELEDMWSK